MTDTKRMFMGIEVEGRIRDRRTHVPQKPIEDLLPYFKEAFDKGVLAISWSHYTPGWNDGDVCEFTVTTPSYTTNPKVAAVWLEDEAADEDDYYGLEESLHTDYYHYEREWSTTYPHPDGLALDIPVDDGSFEHALEEKFGDNTRIIVTPERVVQFEYDCGY
jgi:hypothetical protein